jgi:cell division protein FtsQ
MSRPPANRRRRPSAPPRARPSLRALARRMQRPATAILHIVAVLAVGVGALWLGRQVERHVRTSEAFAIVRLDVEGHVRLTRHEVLAHAGLDLGQNAFDRGPEEAETRLRAHPWVAEATVRRRLPGAFEISLREHRAAAMLLLERPYLVSEEGEVFKPVEHGDPVDLPVIGGVVTRRFALDRPYRTSILLEAIALLHEYRSAGLAEREPIGQVQVEDDGGLTLYVSDTPIHLRLGHGPYRRKLARFRRILDELEARGARPAYVYLDNERRPDRVTVRVQPTGPS